MSWRRSAPGKSFGDLLGKKTLKKMESILGEHTMKIVMTLGVHYGRALSETLRE